MEKERAFFSLFFNDISIPEVNDVFLYCIYIFDLPLQYLKTMGRSKLQWHSKLLMRNERDCTCTY